MEQDYPLAGRENSITDKRWDMDRLLDAFVCMCFSFTVVKWDGIIVIKRMYWQVKYLWCLRRTEKAVLIGTMGQGVARVARCGVERQ